MILHDDCCWICRGCGQRVLFDDPSPGEGDYLCADCYETEDGQ